VRPIGLSVAAVIVRPPLRSPVHWTSWALMTPKWEIQELADAPSGPLSSRIVAMRLPASTIVVRWLGPAWNSQPSSASVEGLRPLDVRSYEFVPGDGGDVIDDLRAGVCARLPEREDRAERVPDRTSTDAHHQAYGRLRTNAEGGPDMQLRRSRTGSPIGYVGDHADKLGRTRPLAHDEDERPRREDRAYGETIFNRAPVPLPRFLRSRRKKS
jgi:hypothetical protein